MSKREKELETLLIYLGFEKRQQSSSHVVFSFPGHPPITIPIKKPFLKPYYVKLAIQAIDDLGLMDKD